MIIPLRRSPLRRASAPGASRSAAAGRDSTRESPRTRIRRRTPALAIPRAAAARGSATRREAPATRRRGSGAARVCFESFSPVRVDRDRHVQIRGLRIAEQPLEQDLSRRRGEEIGAADHVRHALQRVVDDDRKLIRVEPIGAPDDEIADIAREVLRLRALQAVAERRFARRRRARRHARCARAARSAGMPSRQVPG